MDKAEAVHIVLVDDEPRIHSMIGEVLTEAGLADPFESYDDPVAFLTALKEQDEPPDLILLDVHFENSGLTGVDILPIIREEQPYLPVVLLTGMEGEAIEDAQDFECTYYIPKPVDPTQLIRMVKFYLGTGRKAAGRLQDLARDLDEHKELLELLEKEQGEQPAEIVQDSGGSTPGKEGKAFDRISDIMDTVLKNCELLPSIKDDLRRLYTSDFKLMKRAVDKIIQFDLTELSSPGLNIHKVKGAVNVYSLRLSKKARIFFYQSANTNKRRLLRLDPEHATKDMDKWLKANYETYADKG